MHRPFVVFCGLALVAGCGGGPATATVSGAVTVDGQPLASGIIEFIPADQSPGEPNSVSIKDGKYELTTTPGKKTVRITAPVAKKPFQVPGSNASPIEASEESLPDRYHSQSELQFDVKPGSNTKDWTLEGKSRK